MRCLTSNARGRAGQSLIESCIVMGLICLIFLALFQLARLFAAKEILSYAAGRGARARTVGLNRFMVWKTVRLGAIANAGRMVSPGYTHAADGWSTATPSGLWQAWAGALRQTPASEQAAVELSRMPLYLGADWYGQLPPILDYENWDTIGIPDPVEDVTGATLTQRARQDYPLSVPMHRAFYADDSIELSAESSLEDHYSLYLTDLEL